SLSAEQRQNLYEIAFINDNPYIHEAPEQPVTGDQYSINLMWINKEKMTVDQQFLFDDGTTDEKKAFNFTTKFVEPVSKWALANPDSVINIWVDSVMATEKAIERSRQALQSALAGKVHGKIQFRDVRSLDVVETNTEAFTQYMPIYFRVDVLRAVVADHVLRNK